MLVNLWATWCAPCVKELPTLDALARRTRRRPARRDRGQPGHGAAGVGRRLPRQARRSADLGAYHDPKMALSGALGAEVLPTTILYDAKGREVWRYVGDLDWTGDGGG